MISDALSDLFLPADGQCGTVEEVVLTGVALPVLLVLSPLVWILFELGREFVFGPKDR
jgi:hypothetical protein